jgi:glycosyl transferase family 25
MTDFSQLLGIDKVYCISLKKNQEKWPDILKNIEENGFPKPVIFEGILGDSYKNKASEVLGVWQEYILKNNLDRHNHEQFSKFGGLGCYLSHVAIWDDVLKNNYRRVLVFEDDIEFVKNFEDMMKERISYIPTDYDMLFLDVADCFDYTNVNKYFKKIDGLFFGMHSYIITDNAAKVLLPRIFPVELQIDSYISYMGNLSDLNMYYTDGLTDQSFHVSSIQTICVNCDAKQQVGKLRVIFLFVTSLLVIFLLFTFLHVYSFHQNKLISN